ncbi:hypothetical protein [Nonomuraea sp. B19D2]|uniref:hypothetical protein n=1 Tax=Nonomuraea sp. B19D2 TaxID=3159561 RepID=UPI0032DB9297
MPEWPPGDARWRPEWVSIPDYAANIPTYLRILRESNDAKLIEDARVSLEHAVALNHGLYEGAYHLIPFLIELLHWRTSRIKAAIYDLLVEIAYSEPLGEADEVVGDDGRTPVALGIACRDRLMQALSVAWHDLANDDDEDVVFEAMDFIGAVDPDKDRFVQHLRNSAASFSDKCRRNAEDWLAEYDGTEPSPS